MKFFKFVAFLLPLLAFGQGFSENEDPCECDQCRECWEKCMYYEQREYYIKRQVEKPLTVKKLACRPIERSYEVERVRMKPERYTETVKRIEKEYYYVDDVKTVTEWVTEKQYEQVPKYYWQRVCPNPECSTPCPENDYET